MEQLSFKLQQFEGPLDLLLHLIRSNKIDIYDIPISQIIDQYLLYVKKMKEMNLDIASSFLVVAAELLYLKSKMLLPREKDEQGEEIDPRLELVKQLLEYEKYKELAGFLGDRQNIGIQSFMKEHNDILNMKPDNSFLNVSINDLLLAFNDILERTERTAPPPTKSFSGIVAREKVSVHDKILEIEDRLKTEKKDIPFFELFANCPSRPTIVAVFLAVLELLKLSKIIVLFKQKNIYIRYKGDNNHADE